MDNIENILGLVDTVAGVASLGVGFASELLQKHNSKYSYTDDFLASRIVENGSLTDDDYYKGVQLLLIPQMRRTGDGSLS